MSYRGTFDSPLGTLTLLSDGQTLTALTLPVWRFAPPELEKSIAAEELPVFTQTRRWLTAYFAGSVPEVLPPIRTSGTAFRESVWALLRTIPYGQTTSYGALARELEVQIGRRVSARAVGGAVGQNPIAILIPCHRVLGTDGSLTGFGGGLEAKRALLRLEGWQESS